MQVSSPVAEAEAESTLPPEAESFWRPVLYRWFVQYNPLYLLSAALVLAGCFLCSQSLVSQESLAGPLGIALVGEVYALSLLGGAALLTRISLPRPAVMLAMLAVLYQWDLTLHTETCSYLGAPGTWATEAWLAMFGMKLWAFGWALRIRIAPKALAAAAIAGVGLAAGPRVIPALGADKAGMLLAAWLYTLVTLHGHEGREAITSTGDLDAWGRVVLLRATKVAWLLSGALLSVHVFFWWRDHHLALGYVLFAAPLLAVRGYRTESNVWITVGMTLIFAATIVHDALWLTSLLAAITLALRALTTKLEGVRTEHAPPEPYRQADAASPTAEEAFELAISRAQRGRLIVGALSAAFLAAWTVRWAGGALPAHTLLLDAAFTLALALAAWRLRAASASLPLTTMYGHLLVVSHHVPHSAGTWGVTAITVGFALLGASLITSYRMARSQGGKR